MSLLPVEGPTLFITPLDGLDPIASWLREAALSCGQGVNEERSWTGDPSSWHRPELGGGEAIRR